MSNGLRWCSFARRGGMMGCLVACAAAPGAAQAPGPTTNQPPKRNEGTIIGGRPPASAFERCVDVQIGNDGAFACLNQKLRREVDRVNPLIDLPPLDARSPDVRVGNVNEAAVRQQYGSNYGRSVIPYRPPLPANVLPRR